jgi:hypothetical protein
MHCSHSSAPFKISVDILMSTSELLERMMATVRQGPLVEWNKFRNEIVEHFRRATSTPERVALLRVYKVLMDSVEQSPGFAPEDMAKIKEARLSEYRLMLIAEALRPDGLAVPQKMEEITRREIEAGRMSTDDGLREDAVRMLTEMGVDVPPVRQAR